MDVVVHRLGDRDDRHALLVQPVPVGEGVVSTDRDEVVDPEEVQVLQDLGRDVVDLVGVLVGQVRWDERLGQMAGPRPRAVEEGPARTSGAIDEVLRQLHDAGAVVRVGVGNQVDEPRPAAPDAEDAVALAAGPGS